MSIDNSGLLECFYKMNKREPYACKLVFLRCYIQYSVVNLLKGTPGHLMSTIGHQALNKIAERTIIGAQPIKHLSILT
jgi:hypothetical protein